MTVDISGWKMTLHGGQKWGSFVGGGGKKEERGE